MNDLNINESNGIWEWLESRNQWRQFDFGVQKLLNDAYNGQKDKVKFIFNEIEFEAEFQFMIQKNTQTHFERHIRYCVQSESEQNRFFSWQWQDDNKKWISYLPDIVNELEKNFSVQQGQDSTETFEDFDLKISEKLYRIDLNAMTQTNQITQAQRKIKRIQSEFIKDTSNSTENGKHVDDDINPTNLTRSLRKRKLNKTESVQEEVNDEDKPKAESARNKKMSHQTDIKDEPKEAPTKTIVEVNDDEEKEVKKEITDQKNKISVKNETNVDVDVPQTETKRIAGGKAAIDPDDENFVASKRQMKSRASRAKKSKYEDESDDEDDADNYGSRIMPKSVSVKEDTTIFKNLVKKSSISRKTLILQDLAKTMVFFHDPKKITDSCKNLKGSYELFGHIFKTLKFTGRIPVDEQFLETMNEDYHVYIENNIAYDCMLNQTNLQFNNNKYYLIQLLEQDKSKSYGVWFRWGRVGKKGQTSFDNCGGNLEKAKTVFETKFFDKTKNEWAEKDMFEKVAGKYDLVHKDYAANNEDEEIQKIANKVDAKPVPKSKLDERIQKLVEFVCNVQEMESILKEMKYDAKKAPLGKLSGHQIKAGYTALQKLEQFIKDKNFDRDFINACNEFYTRIPHDFGMRVPEPIRTPALLKEKLQLLEALGDIEIAIKALNQQSDIENPIDRHYEQLGCKINLIDRDDQVFGIIEAYLHKTHAPTHCTYKMKLIDIFEVEKQHEKENFKDLGNRMLLWHGSRNTNWAGILSTGLRVAPPEAPVTGYMFGKGCYFADCSSKSANYCYATKTKNIGLLALFDVSLGEPNELINSDYDADKLPANKHSTKGLGKHEPDRKQWVNLEDNCVVPIGELMQTGIENNSGYTLLYNEYVVYDVRQIKMRYLLKIEFDFI